MGTRQKWVGIALMLAVLLWAGVGRGYTWGGGHGWGGHGSYGYRGWWGGPGDPPSGLGLIGVYATFVQKLSLTYYTPN